MDGGLGYPENACPQASSGDGGAAGSVRASPPWRDPHPDPPPAREREKKGNGGAVDAPSSLTIHTPPPLAGGRSGGGPQPRDAAPGGMRQCAPRGDVSSHVSEVERGYSLGGSADHDGKEHPDATADRDDRELTGGLRGGEGDAGRWPGLGRRLPTGGAPGPGRDHSGQDGRGRRPLARRPRWQRRPRPPQRNLPALLAVRTRRHRTGGAADPPLLPLAHNCLAPPEDQQDPECFHRKDKPMGCRQTTVQEDLWRRPCSERIAGRWLRTLCRTSSRIVVRSVAAKSRMLDDTNTAGDSRPAFRKVRTASI